MKPDELESLPLFDGLDEDVVRECAERFRHQDLLPGAVLAREGEFAYKFFVVLDGEVEVLRDAERLATLGPGEFFGEMGVMEAGRRNARVVATTRCRLAWMLVWDFDEMTRQHPEIAARIRAAVDQRAGSHDG